jgi:hypothetical protein
MVGWRIVSYGWSKADNLFVACGCIQAVVRIFGG